MRTKLIRDLLLLLILVAPLSWAQDSNDVDTAVAEEIDVRSVVSDQAIVSRLTQILEATEWFDAVVVSADAGVVFLDGFADNSEHREWAERLTTNTEGVVAAVNRIEVNAGSAWDLSPALDEFYSLGNAAIRHSPMLILSMILLLVTWLLARWAARGSRVLLESRISSKLLRDVIARSLAIPVFLLGLYFVLSVSGLTGLAVTVVGSTGVMGLILGFAFRDIAENFLASVLISMNRPFATGDRIEVAGYLGFVQSVNTRSTLLMTLEGNHVQIPNATIYKSTITNFTANPKARFNFTIGIGYEASITQAQQIALDVLRNHPAVIDDPESLILVEELGASTVNITVYFWVDGSKFSATKVRSAVIRQIKAAFEDAGISMPDEAREVVFPKGVPVQMLSHHETDKVHREDNSSVPDSLADNIGAEEAEGDYSTEAEDIEKQARESRKPEGGENLLES